MSLKTDVSVGLLSVLVLSGYSVYLSHKGSAEEESVIVAKVMKTKAAPIKVTEVWLNADTVLKPKKKIVKTQPLQEVKIERMYTEKEINCMARNIYFEARGESIVGQYAVATVTANRMRSGYWGKSICSVVYSPKQFSWTTVKRRAWIKLKGEAWETSKKVARSALIGGVRVKELEKALFYHATYVDPYWKSKKALIKQVGTHVFYHNAKGANYSV